MGSLVYLVFKIVFILYVVLVPSLAFTEDRYFWKNVARYELNRALEVKQNKGEAKNVIIFVGDGMGPNTVTASRIYAVGESGRLSWENFPHMGTLKTYAVDKQVPDSACTATALFCGVKSNYETLGLDARVSNADCESSLHDEVRLTSIADWAQAAGKSTGFVTTTRVTHATPAALYARSPERKWECEASMPLNALQCKDIARQLIEDKPGKNFKVIMGGGRQCLSARAKALPNDPISSWTCLRKDGRDLIEEWQDEKRKQGVSFKVANASEHLTNIDSVDYLLGIFSNAHMNYNYERDTSPRGMPSLAEMTEAALKILSKDENGFVLMVEGGLIDQAHHRGKARKALDETAAFSEAVDMTMQYLKSKDILDETLVIVTSDHTHGLAINGYPKRGNDILGIALSSKIDGMPYTTLTYGASGRDNYQFKATPDGRVIREDPSTVDTRSFDYSQQASVLTDETTHGGGDVVVHATGPWAHLFHTVHEQNYVATVIAYAAKLGEFSNRSNAGCILSSYFYMIPLTYFVLKYIISSI